MAPLVLSRAGNTVRFTERTCLPRELTLPRAGSSLIIRVESGKEQSFVIETVDCSTAHRKQLMETPPVSAGQSYTWTPEEAGNFVIRSLSVPSLSSKVHVPVGAFVSTIVTKPFANGNSKSETSYSPAVENSVPVEGKILLPGLSKNGTASKTSDTTNKHPVKSIRENQSGENSASLGLNGSVKQKLPSVGQQQGPMQRDDPKAPLGGDLRMGHHPTTTDIWAKSNKTYTMEDLCRSGDACLPVYNIRSPKSGTATESQGSDMTSYRVVHRSNGNLSSSCNSNGFDHGISTNMRAYCAQEPQHACPRCSRVYFSGLNRRRCISGHVRRYRAGKHEHGPPLAKDAEIIEMWNDLDAVDRAGLLQMAADPLGESLHAQLKAQLQRDQKPACKDCPYKWQCLVAAAATLLSISSDNTCFYNISGKDLVDCLKHVMESTFLLHVGGTGNVTVRQDLALHGDINKRPMEDVAAALAALIERRLVDALNEDKECRALRVQEELEAEEDAAAAKRHAKSRTRKSKTKAKAKDKNEPSTASSFEYLDTPSKEESHPAQQLKDLKAMAQGSKHIDEDNAIVYPTGMPTARDASDVCRDGESHECHDAFERPICQEKKELEKIMQTMGNKTDGSAKSSEMPANSSHNQISSIGTCINTKTLSIRCSPGQKPQDGDRQDSDGTGPMEKGSGEGKTQDLNNTMHTLQNDTASLQARDCGESSQLSDKKAPGRQSSISDGATPTTDLNVACANTESPNAEIKGDGHQASASPQGSYAETWVHGMAKRQMPNGNDSSAESHCLSTQGGHSVTASVPVQPQTITAKKRPSQAATQNGSDGVYLSQGTCINTGARQEPVSPNIPPPFFPGPPGGVVFMNTMNGPCWTPPWYPFPHHPPNMPHFVPCAIAPDKIYIPDSYPMYVPQVQGTQDYHVFWEGMYGPPSLSMPQHGGAILEDQSNAYRQRRVNKASQRDKKRNSQLRRDTWTLQAEADVQDKQRIGTANSSLTNSTTTRSSSRRRMVGQSTGHNEVGIVNGAHKPSTYNEGCSLACQHSTAEKTSGPWRKQRSSKKKIQSQTDKRSVLRVGNRACDTSARVTSDGETLPLHRPESRENTDLQRSAGMVPPPLPPPSIPTTSPVARFASHRTDVNRASKVDDGSVHGTDGLLHLPSSAEDAAVHGAIVQNIPKNRSPLPGTDGIRRELNPFAAEFECPAYLKAKMTHAKTIAIAPNDAIGHSSGDEHRVRSTRERRRRQSHISHSEKFVKGETHTTDTTRCVESNRNYVSEIGYRDASLIRNSGAMMRTTSGGEYCRTPAHRKSSKGRKASLKAEKSFNNEKETIRAYHARGTASKKWDHGPFPLPARWGRVSGETPSEWQILACK